MNSSEKQPFWGHLEELRKRLVICAVAVGIGFVLSYIFAENLFQVLVAPLKDVMPEGDRLIFTNLPEMFFHLPKGIFYLRTSCRCTGYLLPALDVCRPGALPKRKKARNPLCFDIHDSVRGGDPFLVIL